MATSGEFYSPFKGRFVPSDDKAEIGSTAKPVNVITATTVVAALTGNVTGDVTGNLTGNVTGNVSANQRLAQLTAAVGNAADTNEADLFSFAIPAGKLANVGDLVRLKAWVKNAANANNKQTRVYFGGTTIGDSTVIASNNNWWVVEAVVIRTGAATQVALCHALNNANSGAWTSATGGAVTQTAPSETLSGAVTIRLTGTSGTTGAADDVQLIAAFLTYESTV